MEKNRETKLVAITSMLIAVVFLTIAYAVFSKSLNIQNISATVKANEANFKVLFSSSNTGVVDGLVNYSFISGNGTVPFQGTIDNSNSASPRISGLGATFKEPGATVQYRFYAINQGSYDAYLKKVEFGNATSATVHKKCTAKSGASQALVNQACDGIRFYVNVTNANDAVGSSKDDITSTTTYTNRLLKKGEFSAIFILIDYSSSAALADGDFDVEFGDITLDYSTQDT